MENFFSTDLPVQGLFKETKTVHFGGELACRLVDRIGPEMRRLMANFPAVSPRLAPDGQVKYNRHRLDG